MTSIYIHWPYCASICPYCDFNSHLRNSYPQEAFAKAIAEELRFIKNKIGQRTISTIFFGGGTPSLMDASTVDSILTQIGKIFNLAPNAEISLEANPSSFEINKFKDFKSAGVNRISVGIQALNNDRLKQLGRKHNLTDSMNAINQVSKTFDNFSFDFIYATPNQTLEDWQSELELILNFSMPHLSLYQLTIEPNTPFAQQYKRKEFIMPHNDLAAEFYELTAELTGKSNFKAYEVSNYSQPNFECKHNLNYWRYGEYIGVGPGAHGRINDTSNPPIKGQQSVVNRQATLQFKMPEKWLNENVGQRFDQYLALSVSEMAEEQLLMGLRLIEGISTNILKDCTQTKQALQKLVDEDLISLSSSILPASPSAFTQPTTSEIDNVNFDNVNFAATPKGRLILQALTGYLVNYLRD